MKVKFALSGLMFAFLPSMLAIAGPADGGGAKSSQSSLKIAPLLGAYAYLSHQNGPMLKQQMDAHKSFPEFERFEAALKAIGGEDLINQLGFVEQEFVIPMDQIGFTLDLSKQNKAKNGLPSYALVTTPSGDDGKVFVVLAMQSPSRVTILWMDKSLNGGVVYDSSKVDSKGDVSQGTPFASTSSLSVLPGAQLKLVEFVRSGSLPTQQPRAFLLNLTPNPSISLAEKQRGQNPL